jgi:hypothetical protein
MNPEDIMLYEINQLQRDYAEWFHLHEAPRVVKFRHTESPVWLPGTEEGVVSGYRLSDGKDDNLLEVCGGNGCTTMWTCLML